MGRVSPQVEVDQTVNFVFVQKNMNSISVNQTYINLLAIHLTQICSQNLSPDVNI